MEEIKEKIKKHLEIMYGEMDSRDFRSQALLANNLYKLIIGSKDTKEKLFGFIKYYFRKQKNQE